MVHLRPGHGGAGAGGGAVRDPGGNTWCLPSPDALSLLLAGQVSRHSPLPIRSPPRPLPPTHPLSSMFPPPYPSALLPVPSPPPPPPRFTSTMLWVFPLVMIFAWLFPVAMTVRGIVHEKELRLKEYMKMMGLGEGVLRASWFITAASILSVSVVIVTILLKVRNVQSLGVSRG